MFWLRCDESCMTRWRCLALLLFLVVTLSCGQTRSPSPLNQQQPLPSPSGQYVLTVPIEEGLAYDNFQVWQVTIADAQGNLLYKDEQSRFVGTLNVYWVWDADDRVWLYNSDTGRVFFWEPGDGTWVKTEWGYGRVREIERDVEPPPELYPPYVK